MSIRSQDDYELLAHIRLSLQSAEEALRELERRKSPIPFDLPDARYGVEYAIDVLKEAINAHHEVR